MNRDDELRSSAAGHTSSDQRSNQQAGRDIRQQAGRDIGPKNWNFRIAMGGGAALLVAALVLYPQFSSWKDRHDYQQKALASCARIQEGLTASIVPDLSPLDPNSPNFSPENQATFSRAAYKQYLDKSGRTVKNETAKLLREPAPSDLNGQHSEVSKTLRGFTSALHALRVDVSEHLPQAIPAARFISYQNSAPVQTWWTTVGTLGDALTSLAGEECKIEPPLQP